MAISLGVLFGIITMLSWGFSDFFAAKASRKSGAVKTILWSQAISVIILFILFLLFFNMPKLSLFDALLTLGCAALGAIGLLSLYKGFEIGKISIISPVASASAAVTAILSVFILGEKLSFVQNISIVLIIIGTILTSFKLKDLLKLNLKNTAAGAHFGIISMFSFGISFVLMGMLIQKFGWFLPVLFIKAAGLAFIASFATIKKETSFPKNIFWLIIAISILETVAFLSIGAGISMEYTSIVYPIASAFPAATIILARIFFKETLEKNQMLGVLCVLAGLMMLSL